MTSETTFETATVAAPDRIGSDAPLTERVLRRLPGPPLVWTILWALVAPLRPALLIVILAATGESARAPIASAVFLTQGVFAYVTFVLLLGTRRLYREISAVEPSLAELAPTARTDVLTSRSTSVAGPVILTGLVVVLATPSTLVDFGPAVAVVDVPLLFVMTLPIMTYVWTYLALLYGLHRLGGQPLVLDRFPEDRSLGLGPLGATAFTGFWLVFAAAVPALLASGRDVTTFFLSLGVVAIVVLLFLLSLLRLHDQMRAAKLGYQRMARGLVADAYAPIGANPAIATVADHAAALGAAQALADRADRLLEWPIDDRTAAFMTVVVTGVVTSLIVTAIVRTALG